LCCELDLLDRTLVKLHMFPEDLALAQQPDLQGLGGSQRMRASSVGSEKESLPRPNALNGI
jgi:hypothetical protein